MKIQLSTTPIETNLIKMANMLCQLSIAAVIFCVCFTLSVDSKAFPEADPVCGYESCPAIDPDAINVHLIPHSHDDVGWLKTYEQYYFQDVQNVISSVIIALKQNPTRRFVQVETAYFKKWWEVQPEAVQQDVVQLINSGQFEIINGAWSMNDEAAVHYQSTIDQYTLGFRYLEDRLGACARPKVAWQIDPFGHSREQASITARLGFDGIFFARIDYRDKDKRRANQDLELLWRGSANLEGSDIFTQAFSGHYSAPSGFCFDIVCRDEPIIDDEESPDYNYEKRVSDFANFVNDQAKLFATNQILVTLGDDFRYTAALNAYINYDRLIDGFKLFEQNVNGTKINVFYSTPSCYTKAVNDYVTSNKVELQVKTDDFFPYADSPNTYWTGYFTSRPASKRFEREANNLLQVSKQLAAAVNKPYDEPQLNSLKEAVGVLQHHDAITGTEKQHVTNNYHLMLTAGLKNAAEASGSVLSALIGGKASDSNSFTLDSCLLANISSCPQSDSSFFTIVVYNPLSRTVSSPISVPVDGGRIWFIVDDANNEVVHDVNPAIADFSYTDLVTASSSLDFVAADLPPLGYKVYQVQAAGGKNHETKLEAVPEVNGYDDTSFEIDDKTGLLSSVTMNGVSVDLKQEFLYYTSQDSSGAYIFVPKGSDLSPVATEVKVTAFAGNVSRGVVQEFGSWAKQIIRVYEADQTYIEFDWVIGPIDLSDNDNKGKEIISQFTSALETDATFYTDSNGRELLKRVRNFRPDFDYSDEQPISGNYYPINSKIVLRDEKQELELAVLTDRSEGGASIKDGQLEIMVHRACHHDDGRGVGESLNEKEFDQGIVVRGKHFLVVGNKAGDGTKSIAAIERDVAQRKLLGAWPFLSKKDLHSDLVNLQFSNLKRDLPENVQILTLEPWKEGELLIRLEHVLEKDEDENLSKDVTVDLSDLFVTFDVTELKETTLGGNIPIEESNRLTWPGSNIKSYKKQAADDLSVTLSPMQIRTFIATVTFK